MSHDLEKQALLSRSLPAQLPSQLVVILLLAGVLFLPWLGAKGFTMSEGHRVVPAWEMLRGGDWTVPHMFGRVYLRKPPGMPWAIAASSALFGQTEFAARLVSVLATAISAMAACIFAGRWYGRAWGLCAGLTLLLMPAFWSPATRAEIEALHDCLVLIASLSILDLGLSRTKRSLAGGIAVIAVGGLSLGAAILTKGPAGLPVIGAALAAILFTKCAPIRTLFGPVLSMLIIAAALCVPELLAMKRAAGLPDAVTQGVDEFLWSRKKLLEILALPLMGLLASLPASLAMLFPWGADARRESVTDDDVHARRVARVCSIALLLALAAYACIGVSNPRYLFPALGLAALTTPYVFRAAGSIFTRQRTRIARAFLVHRPLALVAILTIVGVTPLLRVDQWREGDSGRDLGRHFGQTIASLPNSGPNSDPSSGGIVVRADHAIEARPEVLLQAARTAAARGTKIRPQWSPLTLDCLPDAGGFLLLREDPDSDETARLTQSGALKGFRRVADGQVSKFKFGLYLREK